MSWTTSLRGPAESGAADKQEAGSDSCKILRFAVGGAQKPARTALLPRSKGAS